MGLLSLLILLPLAGALVLLFARSWSNTSVKQFTLGMSLILFGASLSLLAQLPAFEASPEYRFVEQLNWLRPWGISYSLGIDGLSLWLIILSTLLTPISLLGSCTSIDERFREFNIFILF